MLTKKLLFIRSIFVLIVIAFSLLFLSGCKKSSNLSDIESVVAELSQTSWSLNYTNSSGNVEFFLRGAGIGDINLDSIALSGDNSAVQPLQPTEVRLNGDHIRVVFRKSEVLGILSDLTVGSIHTVTLSYTMGEDPAPKQASVQVTVSDESDDGGTQQGDFQLEVDPTEWSLSWDKSNGTVEVFIRGENIAKVDLTSFTLKGDNPAIEALKAISAVINNDHIHARFAKNLLMALLLNPAEGSTHTITVVFVNDETDEEVVLTADIVIEADDDSEEPVPAELSLEIEPEEWNLNFVNSSGLVKAFIEGENLDTIDLESFKMQGDNPGIEPLAADSASLKGDHIQVRFPKNLVIGLLFSPEEGSTHTITILFLVKETGEELFLTANIVIEDDEDDDDDDDGEGEGESDLELTISPKNWNLNYDTSSGNVTAFIRGDGIDSIDLDSIQMYGDNGAAPLAADGAKLAGNHVQADFPKNQVLALLDNPAKGSVHQITVAFTVNGSKVELTYDISIK